MTRSRSSRNDAQAAPPRARSPFIRGAAGAERGEQELQRQKERKDKGMDPFRFYVKEGETTEFIVLDDKPDFFMYEHGLKNLRTGKWTEHAVCIDEFENCPICAEVGTPAYVMFLSVIDLTPYTSKDGKTVEWTRKLLPIKTGQQKKFMRVYEREGSLRGACFETSRDSRKEAAIGGDIQFLEFEEERELKGYVRKWEDRDRKAHTEDCSVPFEYEKLFTVPTVGELNEMIGKRSRGGDDEQPGSRREAERTLDEPTDNWKGEENDGKWQDQEEAPRARRGRGRDQEPEEEAPRARRGRGREPEPEDDGEAPWSGDEEQAAPTRRGRGSRNAARDDDEEAPRAPRGRRR